MENCVPFGSLKDLLDSPLLNMKITKMLKVNQAYYLNEMIHLRCIILFDSYNALDAVRALDGREICGQRVRVEMRKKQRRIGNERTENDLR